MIPDELKPKQQVAPSTALSERILNLASEQANPVKKVPLSQKLWRWGAPILSAAAVVAFAVVMIGQRPAYAARKYFEGAIHAMSNLQSMYLSLQIRTLPHENFSYIDPQADFVEHRVQVLYGEKESWRIEKLDRVALYNGVQTYQWVPTMKCGWYSEGENTDDLTEVLIDPRLLMQAEIELAKHTRGASYELTELPDGICLVVEMPALGDFSQSDYMLNTSILESHTRRTYHFDRTTGRLTYAHIVGLLADGERTLLESGSIHYNEPIDRTALTTLPEGISWSSLVFTESNRDLCGVSPKEAAHQIIVAMESWDEELLRSALHYFQGPALLVVKQHYKGVKLLAMEEPFRSGAYPGYFVPCRLLKRSGEEVEINLALRNDNPNQVWLVDGGL